MMDRAPLNAKPKWILFSHSVLLVKYFIAAVCPPLPLFFLISGTETQTSWDAPKITQLRQGFGERGCRASVPEVGFYATRQLLRFQLCIGPSPTTPNVAQTSHPAHFQLQRKSYPRKCLYYKGLETQPRLFHERRSHQAEHEFSAILKPSLAFQKPTGKKSQLKFCMEVIKISFIILYRQIVDALQC
jgi:hypothetical protein